MGRENVDNWCILSERHLFLGLEEEGPAVEVATDEVAKDLTEVDDEDGGLEYLIWGRDEEVEGVGNRVGEATENEDGHAQQ